MRHRQAMALKRESSYQGSVSRRLNRVFPVFLQGCEPKERTLMDTPENPIVRHRALFGNGTKKKKQKETNSHRHAC